MARSLGLGFLLALVLGCAHGTGAASSAAERQAVIEANLPEIHACWANVAEQHPGKTGTVLFSVDLRRNGSVDWVDIDVDEIGVPKLITCALKRIKTWRFPAGPRRTIGFGVGFTPATAPEPPAEPAPAPAQPAEPELVFTPATRSSGNCELTVSALLEAQEYRGPGPITPSLAAKLDADPEFARMYNSESHGDHHIQCVFQVELAHQPNQHYRWRKSFTNTLREATPETCKGMAAEVAEDILHTTKACTELEAGAYWGYVLEPLT